MQLSLQCPVERGQYEGQATGHLSGRHRDIDIHTIIPRKVTVTTAITTVLQGQHWADPGVGLCFVKSPVSCKGEMRVCHPLTIMGAWLLVTEAINSKNGHQLKGQRMSAKWPGMLVPKGG